MRGSGRRGSRGGGRAARGQRGMRGGRAQPLGSSQPDFRVVDVQLSAEASAVPEPEPEPEPAPAQELTALDPRAKAYERELTALDPQAKAFEHGRRLGQQMAHNPEAGQHLLSLLAGGPAAPERLVPGPPDVGASPSPHAVHTAARKLPSPPPPPRRVVQRILDESERKAVQRARTQHLDPGELLTAPCAPNTNSLLALGASCVRLCLTLTPRLPTIAGCRARAARSSSWSAPSCYGCALANGCLIPWSTSTPNVRAPARGPPPAACPPAPRLVPARLAQSACSCSHCSSWLRRGGLGAPVLQRRADVLAEAGKPAIHCMHSTFFNRLSNRGGRGGGSGERAGGYNYEYVRTWTRRVDLFSKHLVIFPINIDNVHWCLAVARIGTGRGLGVDSGKALGHEDGAAASGGAAINNGSLLYFDSNRGEQREAKAPRFATEVLETLHQYFVDEWADKHKMAPGFKRWRLKPLGTGTGSHTALPQQNDGSSCGVFMCAFAEALTRGVQPDDLGRTFSCDDVDDFRALMVADMIRGFVE